MKDIPLLPLFLITMCGVMLVDTFVFELLEIPPSTDTSLLYVGTLQGAACMFAVTSVWLFIVNRRRRQPPK